jgi:hypothetical protein
MEKASWTETTWKKMVLEIVVLKRITRTFFPKGMG